MTTRYTKKNWNEFPASMLTIAKSIALADLPVWHGPFSKKDANIYRMTFHRFREALRTSDDCHRVGSYPQTLHAMLENLVAAIETHVANRQAFYVVFDTSPIERQARKIDPAAAQVAEIARAAFIAAQQAPPQQAPISEPLFTDEEIADKLASTRHRGLF